MAHFAELDENNVVIQVIVVDNNDILDESGNESETKGIEFCKNLLGGDKWIQTSFNGTFRGIYAGVGFTYDSVNDIFVNPNTPLPITEEPEPMSDEMKAALGI
jgi:hypothetical protein